MGFIKFFSNSILLILACKLKLNCHDLRHVTVMTSSSSIVSKLHLVVEYLFHWCKNYKNRPRNARVIVETKWFLLYETRCIHNYVHYGTFIQSF